jgi:hypothetical protein
MERAFAFCCNFSLFPGTRTQPDGMANLGLAARWTIHPSLSSLSFRPFGREQDISTAGDKKRAAGIFVSIIV